VVNDTTEIQKVAIWFLPSLSTRVEATAVTPDAGIALMGKTLMLATNIYLRTL